MEGNGRKTLAERVRTGLSLTLADQLPGQESILTNRCATQALTTGAKTSPGRLRPIRSEVQSSGS